MKMKCLCLGKDKITKAREVKHNVSTKELYKWTCTTKSLANIYHIIYIILTLAQLTKWEAPRPNNRLCNS